MQYGEMHEVIGGQQHQGRIQLTTAVEKPNLFAVGALETLAGEVTILDGHIYVAKADSPDKIVAIGSTGELRAALLVGCYVPAWTDHQIDKKISGKELEEYIEKQAADAGIDTSKPFPFKIVGQLRGLQVHVIRGACPVHAKRQGISLRDEEKPYHETFEKIDGTLVGIFAKDAAGNLTHPGSSMHTHVIFQQNDSDLTGHVEQTGIAAGATLYLPLRE